MLAGSYAQSGDRRAAIRSLAISLTRDPGIAVEVVRRQIRSATSA
jgi:hypothetical protein